jgi:hypothetical protein
MEVVRSTLRPQFIYCCCEFGTDQLFRTNLLDEEQTCHRAPGYQFKAYSRLIELPGGSLLITGGRQVPDAVREVVKIDTLREWAVTALPPMHSARYDHAAVYHSQFLYVLGGYLLSECERYVCAESRWEVLPSLPVACCAMSVVVLDNSLYTLGGFNGRSLSIVQRLSLDSLTWELMQFKLPEAASNFPLFKTDTQVYLVIERTLYSFTPPQVKPIKTLDVGASTCDSCCYSRDTLYYSWTGRIESLAVGALA